MSPDLTRALHDAVDTGPDDSPFDVPSLTGRIRRRRTVRAGVRGGVAVGAVGAVAFGAVYVGGRQPLSVLPAARADAAPGTCGSDIGLLPMADPGRVGLLPSTDGSWYQEDPSAVPQQGTHLGTLLGRAMSPVLVRELSPSARDAAVADLVRSANETLAAAEERRAAVMADPPDAVPLTAGQVAALDRGVEVARQQLEAAETLGADQRHRRRARQPDPDHPRRHRRGVRRRPVAGPAVLVDVLARPLRGLGPDEHGAEHLRDGRGPRGRAVARR